jgi:UDP-glucose 4-epimerase
MRVLVTGLSTHWGGRLAQELERDPAVEAIVGIDRRPPKVALERTEFVEVADAHTLIARIVDAAGIDTVVDTRLVVDSTVTSPRLAHENNVVGTANILAGCGGVERFVFRSSALYYGTERDDPAFFTEDMRRPHEQGTRIERDIVEAEGLVEDFASSQRGRTKVAILRFARGIGPQVRTAAMQLVRLPAIPAILGFDPRIQLVQEDDIVGALEHAVREGLDGVFNVAADGVLSLSEVAGLLGKPIAPILPPFGTELAARPLRSLGLPLSGEVLAHLRYGQGLDNRKLKATGFRYRHTTREAVVRLREHLRVAPLRRGDEAPYRYERAVEEFLRRSPSVLHAGDDDERLRNRPPGGGAADVAALPRARDAS